MPIATTWKQHGDINFIILKVKVKAILNKLKFKFSKKAFFPSNYIGMYISQTFYNLIQKHLIVHYIIPNAITYLFIYFLPPGPDYKLLENILIIPGIFISYQI